VAVMAGIVWRNGLIVIAPLSLFSLFFYGAALAFAPGLMLARLLFDPRRLFGVVGALIVMLLATHVGTSGLFALQYRIFYSTWHAPFGTITWCFQLAFTSAAAIYEYTVGTLYFYLPFGPLPFIGFAWWFARRMH